jgi:hypothetical protein
MAKYYNVKVYTIGVGSEKEVDEVVDSPLGPVVQHKKLQYNEPLLKRLADQTGGQYFHATDNNALAKIYQSINQLEKSKIQVTSFDRFTDKYLSVACCCAGVPAAGDDIEVHTLQKISLDFDFRFAHRLVFNVCFKPQQVIFNHNSQ